MTLVYLSCLNILCVDATTSLILSYAHMYALLTSSLHHHLRLLPASYEIPSDNLIALKRAYHAAASTYTPPTISFGLTECISEGEEVYQCIFEESAKDAKWAASVESAAQTADSCMEGAEDMLKVNECVKPILDIVDTKCSTETFLNACSMLPECISEAEKLGECLEESATDAKWAESIENASKTAESCLEDAENILDLTECFKPVLEIADEKCPIEAALSACGVAHSVFENFVLDLAEDLKAGECCCFICFERVWVSLLRCVMSLSHDDFVHILLRYLLLYCVYRCISDSHPSRPLIYLICYCTSS
jgi:hypothetical protein